MKRQPKVIVIVLNWNSWQDTIECLESVLRNSYMNYHMIVIDNGSSDKSMDYIKAWAKAKLDVWTKPDNPLRNLSYPPIYKPIPYVCYTKKEAENGGNPEEEKGLEKTVKNNNTVTTQFPLIFVQIGNNLGFTGGNNVGIRYALSRGFDYVFVLNNDTVLTNSALGKMVDAALENPEVGMVAPVVFDYYHPNAIDRLGIVLTKSGLGYNRKGRRDGPLLCPSGCAGLYSQEMLSATALNGEYFDEDFFMYCEDTDLGIRAHLKGFKAALAEKATIFHKVGVVSGGPSSVSCAYFLHRNTIWTIVKSFPFKILVKNFLWILLGQLGGCIKNIGRTHFRHVIKGKMSGIRGIKKMIRKRFVDTQCHFPIDKRPFLLRHRYMRSIKKD